MKSTRPKLKDKFKTSFKTSNKVEDRNQTFGRCGGKPHKRNACPAKDSICNSCKRKGHWKKCCKTKTVSEIQRNQDDKEFFFGEIRIDQLDSVSQSPWKADIQVNDQVVNFKLDSGLMCEEYKNNIVHQYPDLFKGLGKIEGEYKINLVENSTPFTLTTRRKVPIPLLSKTKKEKDRMLEMGVIKRDAEPTDWCAPMVVVPKPSEEVRICVDLPN